MPLCLTTNINIVHSPQGVEHQKTRNTANNAALAEPTAHARVSPRELAPQM